MHLEPWGWGPTALSTKEAELLKKVLQDAGAALYGQAVAPGAGGGEPREAGPREKPSEAAGKGRVVDVVEDELFRHVDFGDLFGGLNFDFGDRGFGRGGGGFFARFFGRRRSGPERGDNLEVELEVPLSRIVTGGEEKVVSVPRGAQPGLVLRLRGKGLPHFGGGTRGDLFICLDVRIPDRLTRKERELYERLRELESSGAP